MEILVSGSLAYDRIMDFPGRFSDHIIPDKIHVLNVCFMINGLKENFGGTAGNIAYALSLLGGRPSVIATAGRDFGPYRDWLRKNGIQINHIKVIEDELTACAYITTDLSDNQITAFNPGAMRFSASFDFERVNPDGTIAIISPGNIEDMFRFSGEYKERKIRYIFDPGQSLPVWTAEQLSEMIEGSMVFICNDYELQLTLEKTLMTVDDILTRTRFLIVTRGEHGSEVLLMDSGNGRSFKIPAVKPDSVKDPTGAGDAYRAGLIRGMFLPDRDILHAARIGAVCAAYSVEVYGTQNFHFTPESFNSRFEAAFGEMAF